MMARNHNELEIYKQAYEFALEIYKATAGFPKEEMFGITSQLRRAASSIGANISEGCGRRTDKDFIRFLHIARGSAKECEHFLKLSKDLNYIALPAYFSLMEKLGITGKMLTKFTQNLRNLSRQLLRH